MSAPAKPTAQQLILAACAQHPSAPVRLPLTLHNQRG